MNRKFVLTLSIDDGSVKVALFDVGSGKLKFVEESHCAIETTHIQAQTQFTSSPSSDILVTKLLSAIDTSLLSLKKRSKDKINDVVCISIATELSELQALSIDDEQLAAWQMMDESRPMQDCLAAHRKDHNHLTTPEVARLLPMDRRQSDAKRGFLGQQRSSRSTATMNGRSGPSQNLIPLRTFSTFLRSVLCAELLDTNVFEAATLASFDVQKGFPGRLKKSSSDSKRKPMAILGHVADQKADLLRTAFVSEYVQRRYGFRECCTLAECLPAALAAWITLPHIDQCQTMLKIGKCHDVLLLPVIHDSHEEAIPNPISFFRSSRKIDDQNTATHLFYQSWKGAGTVRDSFRGTYTKTWKAFKQLIDAVCPGGSVGLDNKLFLFALDNKAGNARRFENGIKVPSFKDLRANVRCLIEGQALQVRAVCSLVRLDEGKRRTRREASSSILEDVTMDGLKRQDLKTDRWWIIDECPGAPHFLEIFCQVLGGEFVRTRKSEANGDGGVSASEVGAAVFAAYTHYTQDSGNQSLDLQDLAASLLGNPQTDDTQNSLNHSAEMVVQPVFTIPTTSPTIVCRRSMPSSIHTSDKEVYESQRIRRRPTLPLVPSSLKNAKRPSSSPNNLADSQFTSPLTLTSPCEKHYCASERADVDRFELLAVGDRDMWDFYGAMLEEFLRLASVTLL